MLKLKMPRFSIFPVTIYLFISCVVFNSAKAFATVEEGKQLFQANCARCHMVDRRLTGPALMGVKNRWKDSTDIYKWIKNSQGYISATGDPYAVSLFKEYNSVMPAFPNLTDQDIANILAYVNTPPVVIADGSNTSPEKAKSNNSTLYFIIIGALVIIAFFLRIAVKNLSGMVRTKYNEPPPHKIVWYKRKNYRPLIALLLLFFICWLSYAMYNSSASLGRQKGYAPDQPIKFSHEIHAGINKIDCRYCHVGAERGKVAAIPGIGVCMNCHYTIQEMSPGNKDYPPAVYTPEIKKIYEYAGFDPAQLKYTKNPKPVKWVKVDNLPDHVYFNHSQHVNVAGLKCQTCHGNVQQMKVIEQAENLSMGFCVNCHRETEVKFTTNGFYSQYDELKKKLDSGEINTVKAEDIGATECQRCHY